MRNTWKFFFGGGGFGEGRVLSNTPLHPPLLKHVLLSNEYVDMIILKGCAMHLLPSEHLFLVIFYLFCCSLVVFSTVFCSSVFLLLLSDSYLLCAQLEVGNSTLCVTYCPPICTARILIICLKLHTWGHSLEESQQPMVGVESEIVIPPQAV